jgi:hypothetical protein
MKYEFHLLIEGKDSIEKKIEEPFKNDPKFHLKFLQAVMIPLMISLNLDKEDDISVKRILINPVVEKDEIS